MPQREITYAPNELIHPDTLHGRGRWISSEVEDIVRKLHYGDPTLGWEGDPRLALYRDRDSWVLERLEADGRYSVVCRSAPGVALDDRLIVRLVENDMRKGADPFAALDTQPDYSEDYERMQEGLERVYHAAAKDLGVV